MNLHSNEHLPRLVLQNWTGLSNNEQKLLVESGLCDSRGLQFRCTLRVYCTSFGEIQEENCQEVMSCCHQLDGSTRYGTLAIG